MVAKIEQFTELHRKNMEAAMRMAKLSMENSQRIMALQSELAKEMFQSGVENAKALTTARDPQAVLPYSYAGTMGLLQGESMDRRFFHKLGASLLDRTICSTAGGEALAEWISARRSAKTRSSSTVPPPAPDCSISLRAKSKSVCDAAGKPISISL